MFTATANLMLPTTATGSWPRPRWFDGEHVGRAARHLHDRRPLPRAVPRRARDRDRRPGARRARHPHARRLPPRRGLRRAARGTTTRCSAGRASSSDELQSEATTRRRWLHYPPGTLLNEIYTAGAGRASSARSSTGPARVREALADRAGASRASRSSSAPAPRRCIALFLDIHTPEVQGQAAADLGHGRGHEQGAARARGAGCR